MANAVEKKTLTQDIYNNFYDIVSAIDGENSFFSNRIYPAMPDIDLSFKNSYPIIILQTPETDIKQFSMGLNSTDGTINFEVYTTSAKNRDQIVDKIRYEIETNKGVLSAKNIRRVEFGNVIPNQVARGKIKVHYAIVPIKFKVYTEKTFAY